MRRQVYLATSWLCAFGPQVSICSPRSLEFMPSQDSPRLRICPVNGNIYHCCGCYLPCPFMVSLVTLDFLKPVALFIFSCVTKYLKSEVTICYPT